MAMKCVAHMPQPVAAPAVAIQIQRARACEATARCRQQTAAKLARKQIRPASATRRSSCSAVKQVRTRNIVTALFGIRKRLQPEELVWSYPAAATTCQKPRPTVTGRQPSQAASRMAGYQCHLND